MSLINRLLGRNANATRTTQPPHSQPHSHSQSPSVPHSQISSVQSQMSPHAVATQNATRRELLRVVLRDTLTRHGIPTSWITAEMLVATSRLREPGIHWRLSIKHWDERLMTHTVALQNNMIKRVMSFDPLATNWLMGISWQFALDDESACPPMPHPGIWTAEPHRPVEVAPVALTVGGSGDVISGPVVIGHADPAATAREDLEKLFAIRDADRLHNSQAGSPHTFAPTEPSKLERL
ncbi:hypothetical protein [Caenimonas aquaedulcis]|uniref:Uncharacterized protein n=1 Tax=Caenimonas aquaedulcis TaxID=2793270 RepID=A0A931H3D2_9BURK|nr:hypothetical protein [Caenimonas aquaedulcis]MBG9387777.1 hypothetical protein [Caenimonas aquaedulcis]